MKLKLFAAVFVLALIINSSVNAQVEKKFKITNKTGIALVSIRFALHDSFNWGMDLNTTSKLPINGFIEFRHKVDSNLCAYDIKFADDGAKEYIMLNVDFCKQTDIQLMIPEEKIEPQK